MSPDAPLIDVGVWGSGRVLLVCASCTWKKAYPAATIIRRLRVRGL